MKRYLTRFPSDPEYLALIGAAVYAFAFHEWLAIAVITRLEPSTGPEVYRETSGLLARRLQGALELWRLERAIGSAAASDVDRTLGARFAAMVERRNDIIHAYPGPDTEARQVMWRIVPGVDQVTFVSEEVLKRFIADLEDLERDMENLRMQLGAPPEDD